MYIIFSFVFCHTIPGRMYSSYFLFEIHQIFLYFHLHTNFPASFSASIHTYDLSLKITVYIYIYILSNIFFLYNILKVKKIFFFSFFFCRINNPFCSIDCSLSCRSETCSSYLSFNFIFRGYLSHFFFFSSYCTVITCRL